MMALQLAELQASVFIATYETEILPI